MKIKNAFWGSIISTFFVMDTQAAGWCDFEYYEVMTHGNMTNQILLNGKLKDQSQEIWVTISDGNIGASNLSLVLAAQISGKAISIFLDDPNHACTNFPSWAPFGKVRHIKIK